MCGRRIYLQQPACLIRPFWRAKEDLIVILCN